MTQTKDARDAALRTAVGVGFRAGSAVAHHCDALCRDVEADRDRLAAEVERLRTRDQIAELAIAYVNEPEDTDTDRVTQLYHELEAAVRHMQAVDARRVQP